MTRQTTTITIVLACLFILPHNVYAESTRDAYKRWTFRISRKATSIGGMKVDCTLVGEDLINAWLKDEPSPQAKERIASIYTQAVDNGIFVYLVNFRMKGNKEFIYADFSDIARSAKLYIADEQGAAYYPAYFSGNKNQRLYGGQSYYGLIAFKTGFDAFSFQTLALTGTYVNEAIEEYNNRRNPKRPRPSRASEQFQFAYLPFGVNEADRPGSAPDAGDIFGMMRLALKIMTKLL